ncbi:hypothetical protein R4B61_04925 [Fructilactobacillus vespulae]|uniref:hypothetical protein n=1 Tax=Fructilactobacillus vespulae TaxID=1249630 RepID=UPI0039B65EC9
MSLKKGLFLGALLGGAATYAAYRVLDEEKKYEIRNRVLDVVEDAKDRAVDYVYYAADSIEDAKDNVNDHVTDYKDSFSDTTEKIADKILDLREDLGELQTYLNMVPVPKEYQEDLEKKNDSDDITVDMDDAFTIDRKDSDSEAKKDKE